MNFTFCASLRLVSVSSAGGVVASHAFNFSSVFFELSLA